MDPIENIPTLFKIMVRRRSGKKAIIWINDDAYMHHQFIDAYMHHSASMC